MSADFAPGMAGMHTSHRRLLLPEHEPAGRAEIDAIIVPATRAATNLQPTIELGAALHCPVVVLCSRATIPGLVVSQYREHPVRVIAVAMGDGIALPWMHTTNLRRSYRLHAATDTSHKRNLGLALAFMTGWKRVLFLDDDITGVDPAEIRGAASLLGPHDVVGLKNLGFADNSVVHHAHRDTGGRQDTFIGGGAMLVGRSWMTSMFPDIYNEDWLFLIKDRQLARCTVSGSFSQAEYDPYQSIQKAVDQEFGDCIAEGLFTLLDQDLTIDAAGGDFWRTFIAARRAFIRQVWSRLGKADLTPEKRSQMAVSLVVAEQRAAAITPELCHDFLAAWRRDRQGWLAFLNRQPTGLTLDQALAVVRARYVSTMAAV